MVEMGELVGWAEQTDRQLDLNSAPPGRGLVKPKTVRTGTDTSICTAPYGCTMPSATCLQEGSVKEAASDFCCSWLVPVMEGVARVTFSY